MLSKLIRIIVLCTLPGMVPAQADVAYDDYMLGLLSDFYDALGGDEWHNNDGWLDPGLHFCDWYGITCESSNDSPRLAGLMLRNNNLHGEFPRENKLFTAFTGPHLDLSENSISGTPVISRFITSVNFANNQLSGTLEDALWPDPHVMVDPPPPYRLSRLNLSGNNLDGAIPFWLAYISLDSLNLSDNHFSSGSEAAFRSISQANPASLNLSNNPLSGAIPEWIVDIDFTPFDSATFGIGGAGLNLCWTELEPPDPSMSDFIAAHHRGGEDNALCLNRERLALDPGLSGSWFDPARSGEGLTMMLMENDQVLTYWFSHLSRQRQAWFFNVGQQHEFRLLTPHLLRTRGRFGQGFGDVETPLRPAGRLDLNRVGEDRMVAEFDLWHTNRDFEDDIGLGTVIPFPVSTLQDYARLSRLAGTRCDNQSVHQHLSGLWHDPERSGEGFVVEVLSDERAIIYWFTHTTDGSGEQAWMTSDAAILSVSSENTSAADDVVARMSGEVLQPIATLPELRRDFLALELLNWGFLSMDFFDDGATALVEFSSEFEDFGAGSYPVEQLARPLLAECEG